MYRLYQLSFGVAMEQTYTTTDIVKTLRITRERLRDWMVRGYVKPSVPAPGQGLPAEFTKWDVYMVALFKKLIDRGFVRDEAAKAITDMSMYRRNLPEIDGIESTITHFVVRWQDKWVDGFLDVVYSGVELEGRILKVRSAVDLNSGLIINFFDQTNLGGGVIYFDFRSRAQGDATLWDDIFIINFRKLVKFVDTALQE